MPTEGVIIEDELGNKMTFENGRLIQTVSSINTSAIKKLDLVDVNQPTMYDIRKPSRKFVLNYVNLNLANISINDQGLVKQTISYVCSQTGNLKKISKTAGSSTKTIAMFFYDTNDRME